MNTREAIASIYSHHTRVKARYIHMEYRGFNMHNNNPLYLCDNRYYMKKRFTNHISVDSKLIFLE